MEVAFLKHLLVAQMVKYLPTMWETQIWSLGWEGSPGEGNGNPLFVWNIPWTEEPGRLQSMGSQKVFVNVDWYLHILTNTCYCPCFAFSCLSVKWNLSHCGFVCISLMANDCEHFFKCLSAICLSSLESCSSPLPPFKLYYLSFYCMSSL